MPTGRSAGVLQVSVPTVGAPASPSWPESNAMLASARGYATPVDLVHGALHEVMECQTSWPSASRLSNVIDCPCATVASGLRAVRSLSP